ncbi:hypothetical protein GCM10027404_10750 [Arthrobacter tumbae]
MIVLALAFPALAGCGGAEALDPGAAQSLQQQVRELAVVTQEGNLELAVDRAEALKTEVQQAEDSGAVTSGRAGRIQQNIDAFIDSVQPAEAPAPTTPATPSAPSAEPAPADTVPPTTPNRRRDIEDSGTPAERQQEASEEAAEEAQEFAEKQEKERQKQEEENRGDD